MFGSARPSAISAVAAGRCQSCGTGAGTTDFREFFARLARFCIGLADRQEYNKLEYGISANGMKSRVNATPVPGQSKNLLLAAVAPIEFEQLRRYLEPYPLRTRETLQEAGEAPEFVFFPTSGIISALTVLENGMMIEFATIGREGTTGVPLVVGMSESNLALVSQLPGDCMRMTGADFLEQLGELPSFAAVVTRYCGVMFALLAQSAACNRAHHVDERCARWLLMTHDQAGGDDFSITQEFLAQMLGVSRPSVALSAGALQRAGFIRYHRGEMTIVDRAGLEAAACECYAAIRVHFDHLASLTHY